jgi:valyl-tRNA synthetase
VHGKTEEIGSVLQKHKGLIEYMENVENLLIAKSFNVSNPGGLLTLTGSNVQVRTSMEDADLEKVRGNVLKQIASLEKEAARTVQKLGNPEFVAKAPPEVREEHRQRREREAAMIQLLQQALQQIDWYASERKRSPTS